jgi:hypothetical protein
VSQFEIEAYEAMNRRKNLSSSFRVEH